MELVIKGGTVVGPLGQYEADIGVKGGRIAHIAESIDPGQTEVLEAHNQFVLPGVVDLHTHLAPGGADGFESGTRAAAWGGVTTVVDFAYQLAGKTLGESVDACKAVAQSRAHVDWSLHVAPVEWSEALRREIRDLIGLGLTSFKFHQAPGCYAGARPLGDGALLELLEETAKLGATVFLRPGNAAASALIAERFGREGKPVHDHLADIYAPVLEAEGIGRAAALAQMANANLFITHLSCLEAVEAVARAREAGVNVSAETAPHHLLRQALDADRSRAAVMPPLRTTADSEALWHAIGSGVIEAVSSGHRAAAGGAERAEPGLPAKRAGSGAVGPSSRNGQASGDPDRRGAETPAAAGLPEVELTLPLLFSEGVRRGRMTMPRLTQLLSSHPAMVAGLFPAKGVIQVGSDADLVVLDPEREWTLEPSKLHMGAEAGAFERLPMRGAVTATVLRGRVLRRGEEFLGEAGYGQFLKRKGLDELY